MVPICDVTEVMDAIQKVKEGAPAFCTNLFPVRQKLQNWIDRSELLGGKLDGAACFLRQDRDFWHLYFCASDAQALGQALCALPELHTSRVTADLLGQQAMVDELSGVFEAAGFSGYSSLFRMSRMAPTALESSPAVDPRIGFAGHGESTAILDLLVRSFDRYAEQLPEAYEIQAAVDGRQCLVARCEGELAGLLFFETQGYTSTVRYWLVADRFRAQRVGAALMYQYFAIHDRVRRFILWVVSDNDNAIKRYRHFGYAPDGLVDRGHGQQDDSRMTQLAAILNGIRPEFDFTTSDDFIADGMLDSLDMVTLVATLDKTFDIAIRGVEIVPDNFKSLRAIQALLRRYGVDA